MFANFVCLLNQSFLFIHSPAYVWDVLYSELYLIFQVLEELPVKDVVVRAQDIFLTPK